MGAYSPLPDLSEYAVEPILDRVHRPILAELRRRGTPFVGFLYAGLILTADGPRLLECNARLGDPEAQVLLPRLATRAGAAAARGGARVAAQRLGQPRPDARRRGGRDRPRERRLPRRAGRPGDAIEGLDQAADGGALVFHAATRTIDGGTGWRDGRRPRPDGRRAGRGPRGGARGRGARRRRRSAGRACSAATTSAGRPAAVRRRPASRRARGTAS